METRPWPSEYRVEYLNPVSQGVQVVGILTHSIQSYMFASRPTYSGLPAMVNYGATFTISVVIPSATATVKVVLMDLGFITHSVHMDQKAVELVSTLSSNRLSLTVVGPPSAPS